MYLSCFFFDATGAAAYEYDDFEVYLIVIHGHTLSGKAHSLPSLDTGYKISILCLAPTASVCFTRWRQIKLLQDKRKKSLEASELGLDLCHGDVEAKN